MSKRVSILILATVFLVLLSQPATTSGDNQKETMSRLMDDFVLGVYIGSHGCKIPMDRMFQDFANRSINLLVVNWHNFKLLAPKGLCTLAKNYDIYLVVQLFYEPKKSFDYHYRKIDEHIRFVNSFANNNRVIAWSIGDEPENSHAKIRDYEVNIIRFGKMLREKDSKRLLYMNHMPGFRMPMYRCGEDVSAVSQFWMISWPKGIKELYDKTRAEIQRVTYQKKFITTGIGAGIQWFQKKDCKSYLPGTGITVKDTAKRQSDEDILEYMLTAYENKTQGFVVFVYDGMFDKAYHPYTLTDKNGNDCKGKWSAFLRGSRMIRSRQGWPVCRIVEPIDGQTAKGNMPITICSFAQPDQPPVEKVFCQYSMDGGFSWKNIREVKSGLVTFDAKFPQSKRDGDVLIRARAESSQRASSWHVVRMIKR